MLGVHCLSPSCAGGCEEAGQPVPLPLLHFAQPELTSIPRQTVGRGKGQVCSAPLLQVGERKCFLDSWCCPHTHPLLWSDLGREGKGTRRSEGAGTAAGGVITTAVRLLGAEAPSWVKNGLEKAHCEV